jgi:hypothetical protein
VTTLRLVPDPDENGRDEDDDLTYIPHLADEHEQRLIGALMYVDADDAHAVLDLVPDAAFHDATGRWAYQLIRAVVGDDQDVDPINILVAGRHRGADGSSRTPTPHQQHQLALYLVDARTHTSTPDDPLSRAHAVLENAARRARRDHDVAARRAALDHVSGETNTDERSHP